MTVDEYLDMAESLDKQAHEMRLQLDAAQPHTSAEQWHAWQMLTEAAARVRSCGYWLARHDDKYGKKEK